MNKEIKNAYCFSLRPDIALQIASSDSSFMLYGFDIGYTGLVLIHSAVPESDRDKDDCLKAFQDSQTDPACMNSDSIMARAMLAKIVHYKTESEWERDRETHGYEKSLEVMTKAFSAEEKGLFGYFFESIELLEDFVTNVGGEIGEIWKALEPPDAAKFRQAMKSGVVS